MNASTINATESINAAVNERLAAARAAWAAAKAAGTTVNEQTLAAGMASVKHQRHATWAGYIAAFFTGMGIGYIGSALANALAVMVYLVSGSVFLGYVILFVSLALTLYASYVVGGKVGAYVQDTGYTAAVNATASIIGFFSSKKSA